MLLCDTHCHLDLMAQRGVDINTAIKSAMDVGVGQFVVPGVSPENWSVVAQLAKQFPPVHCALGIHPLFIDSHSVGALPELETCIEDSLLHSHGCIAIGECGLDFYQGRENEKLQFMVLEAQLKMAQHFELPVLLHVRKAHNELIQILKRHPLPKGGVLHGFSGSYEQGMEFIKCGLWLGIGGTITYPRANKTRMAVSRLPLERLLLETDAPDMPLNGYQGTVNEPKFLNEVLSTLITLRSETEQTIAQKLRNNTYNALQI